MWEHKKDSKGENSMAGLNRTDSQRNQDAK